MECSVFQQIPSLTLFIQETPRYHLENVSMILSSETHAKAVIHLLDRNHFAAVLEQYPYPTPTFHIERLPSEDASYWRVTSTYDIRFTENMKQRSDVLGYMIQAQAFVDTTDISTVRDTVTRLLVHWSKLFPHGIPDCVI